MKRIVHFLILFIVWLLLTWSLDVQNVVAGLIVAVIGELLIGHLFFDNPIKMLDPRRIFWFLYYIVIFLLHMTKANLDVAYRVLHKDVPIRPGIVKVKTTMKSDLGLTFLANSITLTPGTLTIDIIDSDMYIHWIYVR
ncbi:MAG: Na+/H+ antiporter subunit E, partial [Candidatus Latescibacteria bacterium]|nr:Na+/H+ antiporter subunit E [Candidatus Latescibacterota bacterium]